MKDKEIRRHTAPILQCRTYPELNRLMDKKGDLGIAKNYRDIILTSLAPKIEEPKIEKIFWKN